MFLARVAELADAPDLGIAKSSISERRFSFQNECIYEAKTGFSYEIVAGANGE